MHKKISEGDIQNAFTRLKDKYDGRKEDYFALLWLMNEYGISEETAIEQVAFGGNDYGIDAYHFDPAKKNLYLFQFKWSDKPALFAQTFERLIANGIEFLFGNPIQNPNANQLLARLKSCLIENSSIIEQAIVQFIFNGDKEKAEQSRALSDYTEQLLEKKYVLDKYFERDVHLSFSFDSNATEAPTMPREKRKTLSYEISIEDCLRIPSKPNELLVTFLPARKLLEMYNDMRESFFDRNIRSGLSPKSDTNIEIERTIRRIVSGEERPDNFVFYHNGISLTASAIEAFEDKKAVKLVEPRILNGAQTVLALSRFADNNKLDERVLPAFDKIRLLSRVIRSNDRDFLNEVTVNNNRQNPIHPWNLKAGDSIQLRFADEFLNEFGIFYERREGSFTQLTDSEKMAGGISERKPVLMTTFAHAILAMQGEVTRMSNMTLVFGNRKIYESVFKEGYLRRRTLTRLTLFYKISQRLRGCLQSIDEKGEEKYSYVWAVRNLVWALLIQGLLNEPDFDDLVDKFGTTLIADADLTIKLKQLASVQIRFILRDTFAKESYSSQIEQQKYSFLRSKQAFEDCMITAKRKYGWEKCSV